MQQIKVNTSGILLVEDDADDILLTKRAFEKANVWNRIDVTQSGEEAWKYLTNQEDYADKRNYSQPLFILIDLNMPGFDGRELIARIKGDERLKDIPLVVTSTSDYEKDVELVRKLGVAHYVIKPLKPENILHIIGSLKNVPVVLGEVVED